MLVLSVFELLSLLLGGVGLNSLVMLLALSVGVVVLGSIFLLGLLVVILTLLLKFVEVILVVLG